MGTFKYEPRIAVITFEEPFDGLEIRASLDLPAVRQVRMMRRFDALQKITQDDDETEAEAAVMEAAALFAEVTDGWNYTDAADNPLPLTAETLASHIPGSLFWQLITRWSQTVRGVSAPLAEPSNSDEVSLESQTPTPASESPVSTS